MKLLAKHKKTQPMWLYSYDDLYILKVSKDDVKLHIDSIYSWFPKHTGRHKSTYLIREDFDAVKNGYSDILKDIPTDFRYFNLVIIKV